MKVKSRSKIAGFVKKDKKIKTLVTAAVEKGKKQHKVLFEVLKAQYELALEESEEELDSWKRQAKELEGMMVKQKKEHESIEEEIRNKQKFILDQLKDKIECPVCLEIPRTGPVHVCSNGHFVCKKCKGTSCPTCRCPMGTGKSLLAVTVIENIDHKCKFSDCEEVFSVDKVDDHEKICEHRTVLCPHESCSDAIPLSKILDHLGQSTCSYDSEPTVIDQETGKGRANFIISRESSVAKRDLIWSMNIFVYQNHGFVVFPRKFENFYYFTLVMLDSQEECSKFHIELEVHERDSSSSKDSSVSFRFSGQPCSIDEEKATLKYLGLSVNNIAMEKILRKSQSRAFSISFRII